MVNMVCVSRASSSNPRSRGAAMQAKVCGGRSIPHSLPLPSGAASRHVLRSSSRQRQVRVDAAGKVAVLGAAGGIGQPLSMLVKMLPNVKELALYDIQGTPGVAADLSHCNTACKVTGYMGEEELPKALEGCELVIIPAGVPRKPGKNVKRNTHTHTHTHTHFLFYYFPSFLLSSS